MLLPEVMVQVTDRVKNRLHSTNPVNKEKDYITWQTLKGYARGLYEQGEGYGLSVHRALAFGGSLLSASPAEWPTNKWKQSFLFLWAKKVFICNMIRNQRESKPE